MNQERSTGSVLSFDENKGEGFIRPHKGDDQDIYVHHSQIVSDGVVSLAEDDEVEFEIFIEESGSYSARKVTVLNESPLKRNWWAGSEVVIEDDDYRCSRDVPICGRCYNCGQAGHMAKYCKHDGNVRGDDTAAYSNQSLYGASRVTGFCFNCGGLGHMARDCDQFSKNRRRRGVNGAFFQCGGAGHIARDCDESSDVGNEACCFKCGRFGHIATDCIIFGTTSAVGPCYSCGGVGHLARNCSSRAESSNRSGKCFTCGEVGHFARECTSTKAS